MMYNVQSLQRALRKLNFYRGNIDGLIGPKTRQAIIEFKKSIGFTARDYVGPLTIQKLKQASGIDVSMQAPEGPISLPWITEINRVWGMHEVRDNKPLTAWLRSDGSLLGDPSKLPWCGDAVETAIRRTLKEEVFPAKLEANPYWARNWALFGQNAPSLPYGAILSFERGSGGHTGFLVGINKDRTLLRVRGGNQRNAVNDTWIKRNRLMKDGSRWPTTYPIRNQVPVPILDSTGAVISTNEY